MLMFLTYELIFFIILFARFFTEKGKIKKQLNEGPTGKEKVEDHITSILALYPPSGVKNNRDELEEPGENDSKDDSSTDIKLIMFYWEEKNKQKIMEGPSLLNALKIVLRRE